tara:strand:- start:42 stop:488 length:447 start_codon:yes stop_codon:yes gene_type:complete
MIREFVKEIVEKTEGMGFVQLFWFIFQNNVVTAFFGLILGLVLGLFPIFISMINGYVIGFVANISVSVAGFSSLWKLAPHGIFELPALIISLGLGLKLGSFIFAKSGKRKKKLKYDLKNSLRVFLFIVIPLLLIAGLIESWLILFLGG